MKRKSFFSAKQITGVAVLLALVIVLQLIGGYLKIGATSFSLVLVPIVVGGLTLGAFWGGFLGYAFGLITLLFGITGADYFTAILFQEQPVFTVLLCLAKGTAAGVVPALLYGVLRKKNEYVAVFTAAASAPIVNTGLFILGALGLLGETITANFVAEGTTLVYFLFIGCAGINFLVELAINLVTAPAVHRLIPLLGKKRRRK